MIFRYFWIPFIAVTILSGFIGKYRSKKYILKNPELAKGYNKYFNGYMIFGNIPWLIIMIGNLSGITQSFFEYLDPKSLNPIVLLFHFYIIVLWILGIIWIYFKGGAEFIEMHPGLVQRSSFSGNTNVTAKQVKLFFPLMLLGGIAGMITMWM